MSKDTYTIRAANLQDAEGIANVHVKSWQTSYAGVIDQQYLENISYEQRLQFRKEILQSANFQCVVLYAGHIVGFADAGFMQDEKNLDRIGVIYAIYLLQEHQGCGLGRELFAQCKQWYQEQGVDRFSLWVLKDNTRARRFYATQGGEIVGEKKIKIGDEEFLEFCYQFVALA